MSDPSKRLRIDFDDPNEDFLVRGEPERQEADECEEYSGDPPDEYFHELLGDQGACGYGLPRRRLRIKSSPLMTGYSNTALLTRSDYKIAMEQRRNKRAAHKSARAVTVCAAISLLAAQPEIAFEQAEAEDQEVAGDSSNIPRYANPHPSHDIQSLSSHIDIIYCRRCAAWAKNVRLKALAKVCEGLKEGNKGQLRKLQLGLVPLSGVKIPAHLRRTFARGRRRR